MKVHSEGDVYESREYSESDEKAEDAVVDKECSGTLMVWGDASLHTGIPNPGPAKEEK